MKKTTLMTSLLITLLFPAILLAADDTPGNADALKNKKIVMIIAKHMFQETEFQVPKDIFDGQSAQITIASSTLSEAISDSGRLRIKPDILVEDIRVNDFDAIVFIGGFGCSEYIDNYQAHQVARQAMAQNKILAAICKAPEILANAGLLKGKKATAFSPAEIKAKGAIVTDNAVVRDGNIITGNGPGAAQEFGETIVAALSE